MEQVTNNTRLFELVDRLKELRDEKDTTEAMLKQISAEIDAAEYALVTYMVDTETQNFTHAGTMFSLRNTVRASAAAGNKDELFTALRSAGYGDLVYETVNANSLSAFVREQMAENEDTLPEWLTGLVNVFEKTTIGVRNAKKH